MQTVADLRRAADDEFFSGVYDEALLRYGALAKLQPLNLDARLRIADSLLALGEVQRAAVVYTALVRHAARAGHPLRALVALKVLTQLDARLGSLVDELAGLYAAGSDALGRGARPAPPDPTQRLPEDFVLPPLPAQEQLAGEAERVGADFSQLAGAYPPKLMPLPLFSLLPAGDFAAVVHRVRLLRAKAGTGIIRQGEPGSSFYVLVRGSVRVSRELADGARQQLARLHDGAIFGEMALLTSSPRSAHVEAESDCDLLELDRDALAGASETLSSVARALQSFTEERLLNNLFSTSPLFRPLDREQRVALMRRFVAVDVPRGGYAIRQGQPGRGLFLLLRGEVEVRRDEDDRANVLATLGPGEIFGEIALLTADPTTADVVATTDSTALFLGREYFERLCAGVPEIKRYIEGLGEQRMLDQRLSVEALQPVDADESEEIEVLL